MTKNNGTIFHIKMHHQWKANNNANFGNQVNVKTTSVSENWKIFFAYFFTNPSRPVHLRNLY